MCFCKMLIYKCHICVFFFFLKKELEKKQKQNHVVPVVPNFKTIIVFGNFFLQHSKCCGLNLRNWICSKAVTMKAQDNSYLTFCL